MKITVVNLASDKIKEMTYYISFTLFNTIANIK
jgi:hypothetical protein